MLNTAEAPLAFSRAARLGRGAMTLGAMPCPARWREVSEKKTKKTEIERERGAWKRERERDREREREREGVLERGKNGKENKKRYIR